MLKGIVLHVVASVVVTPHKYMYCWYKLCNTKLCFVCSPCSALLANSCAVLAELCDEGAVVAPVTTIDIVCNMLSRHLFVLPAICNLNISLPVCVLLMLRFVMLQL